MKPQDILILAKIFCIQDGFWTIESISDETGVRKSEAHNCVKRLYIAGLLSDITFKPITSAMEEFLIHGIRYVYPAIFLPDDRGILTAHSSFPLNSLIVSDGNEYVWPHCEGTVRGTAIKPLYPSVPDASLKDQKLYAIMSLIESIRIGRVRERQTAADLLSKMLRGEKAL